MMQSGGFICDIPISGSILSNLAKKRTNIARDLGKEFLNEQIDMFNKRYITGKGSEITVEKKRLDIL